MIDDEQTIKFYGTDWCSDCRRSFFYLKRKGIPFEYINIDNDSEGEALVIQLNHGNRSVPTIIFPDGSMLVEPSTEELAAKFSS
jgi:mycoredoxin